MKIIAMMLNNRFPRLCALAIFLLATSCSLDASLLELGSKYRVPVELTSSLSQHTNASEIPVQLTFGIELAEKITSSHLRVSGGVIKDDLVREDQAGQVYSFTVIPNSEGQVQIQFPSQSVYVSEKIGARTTNSSLLNLNVDTTSPQVVVSSAAPNPTGQTYIPFEITFTEPVSGLTVQSFQVINASAILLTGSGARYTLSVSPLGVQAQIQVQLLANQVKDLAGNDSFASNSFTLTYDGRNPTPTLSSTVGNPTHLQDLPISLDFDIPVTGLIPADFMVTNGTLEDLTGSGTHYSFKIRNSNDGVVKVLLPANAAQSALGNQNLASNELVIHVNRAAGGLLITGPVASSGNNSAQFLWTLDYSDYQSISLNTAHISVVTTGTVSCAAPTLSSIDSDTRQISLENCSGDGTAKIAIASGSAKTPAGEDFAANSSATAAIVDNSGPVLSFVGPTPILGNKATSFVWTVNYATEAHGFFLKTEDVGFTGTATADCAATVSAGNPSTISVTGCTGNGTLGITLVSGTATDIHGNASLAASSPVSGLVDNQSPQIQILSVGPSVGNKLKNFEWEIGYSGADQILLEQSFVTLTGATAGCASSLSQLADDLFKVQVSGCTGNGALTLRILAGSAKDTAGNLSAVADSPTVTVDNLPPTIAFAAPSRTVINQTHEVTWLVTFTGHSNLELKAENIEVLTTLTVNSCQTTVVDDSAHQKTIKISGCQGDGTVRVRVSPGVAEDEAGNLSVVSAYSATVTVDNTAPILAISQVSPSSGDVTTVFSWIVNYTGASSITLAPTDITVVGDGAEGCTVTVTGSGNFSRTVKMTSCSNYLNQTASLEIKAGTAVDTAGNSAAALSTALSVMIKNFLEVNFTEVTSSTSRGTAANVQTIGVSVAKSIPHAITVNFRNNDLMSTAVNPTHHNIPATGVLTIPANNLATALSYTYQGGMGLQGSKVIHLHLTGVSAGPYNVRVSRGTHRRLVIDSVANDSFIQVHTTGRHICGITAAKALKCWGENSWGQIGDNSKTPAYQPRLIDSGVTYAAVSAGQEHTCAVTVGGVLKCWGKNSYGQLGTGNTTDALAPSTIGSSYKAVSVGSGYSCALTTGNVLRCWGSFSQGKLGLGALSANVLIPTDVGTGFTQISAGFGHVCAQKNTELFCWGANSGQQLGDNLTADRNAPYSLGTGFKSVSAGSTHTCAIKSNDELYCWGYGYYGQLGQGQKVSSGLPQQVTGLYKSVSAMAGMTCAIDQANKLFCWGQNAKGQLGDFGTEDRTTPQAIDGATSYSQISVGGEVNCGVDTLGAAKCWGLRMASIGDTLAPLTASTVVDPVSQYSYVTALKVAHRCGITLAGQLQCWGSNSYGQIGTGNKEYVSFPAVIDPGVSYKSVAVNEYSTCAVTSSGLMKCWGLNNYGQMGTGSGVQSLKPMVVDEEERYLKVESGNKFVCGLTTSRVMKCAGYLDWKNLSYVFDFTEMDSTFLSDIVVGTHRVCVKVQSNGSFRCWGEGYTASSNWGSPGTVGGSEEPIVLGGGTAYSQVLPGYGLLCAIAGAAGDLFCAGGNWQGEAGLGHTFGVQTLTNVGSDFRQVAGGYYSTCTLKKTGTGRVCWGMNSSGQLGAGNMNAQILAQTTYDSGIYYERLSEDGNCGLASGWLRCWGIVSGVGELSGVPSPVYP